MANRNPVPELTDNQRRRALKKAVHIRQLRARNKELLKDGRLEFEDFLGAPSVRGMRVEEALRAVPGIGRAKAARIMERVGIAPNRRVRGLGCHQRAALVEEVRDAVSRQLDR